jgi:hypothetical protein
MRESECFRERERKGILSVSCMFPSTGCGKSSTTLTLAAKDPTPSIFDVLMTATAYKPNTNVNNDMFCKLYQIIYHVPILI